MIASQQTIDIVMEPDAIGIEEVVAIGYGTAKKQDVTGSVAVANLERYRDVPVNNVLETVKGTISGLSVGGTNTAGEVAGLQIRGKNTPTAGNAPLIVVDGSIFYGSLGDIAQNDIESFTVLKDASAAAVYGSRSSNGVIIIETKQGKGIDGKPKFDVNISTGISNELTPLKVYDAQGYIQRLLDFRADRGLEADLANVHLYLQPIESENYLATPDHKPTIVNPHDLIGKQGSSTQANINVSNSYGKSKYYISLSAINQDGVVLNDKFKNLSARINISSDLTDWFNVSVNSMYSLRDFSGSSPDLHSAAQISPYASLYNEDGTYMQYPQSTTSFSSPFWTIATSDLEKSHFLSGILKGVVKIPTVEGLSYTINYTNSLELGYRNQFQGPNTQQGQRVNGTGYRSHSNTYRSLIDQILKYNHRFNDVHRIDLTFLYSLENSKWNSLRASAEGFDNTVLLDYRLEDGIIQSVNTGGGESSGIGKMARATYSYDDKYSITGTVRRDGFSGFSKNKKWGTFSSVGVNWNISKERFLENVNGIDNLALRVSYGSNGNQSLSPYSTLVKIATGKYLFGGQPNYNITQAVTGIALDNLGWEATTGTNIGLDFGLFNHRLSGTLELYKTNTTNLLFERNLVRISGFSSSYDNVGNIENKGIDFNLSSVNIKNNEFEWTSDFVFSLNRNKVISILGIKANDANGDGIEDDLISAGYFIGKPLGTIYTYKQIGMWQQQDVDNGTIMNGMKPGDYKTEDIDGDGAITSDKDRQFLGNRNANFRWSLTNTFKYKNWSFMAYLYSIWGGNGYYQSTGNTPYDDSSAAREDINHPVYDYWTPSNTNAMFPRADYKTAPYKSVKLFDRSFIKLQKVALSYDFSSIVKPMGINNLKLTLSADNLFTYAPYWKGLDPETGQGLTLDSRPSIRTYLFLLSFNF